MDGAAPLLLGLHGRLLRLVCAHAGCHFEGLAVAGRYLFKQGAIDCATKKKPQNLGIVASFLRHVSKPLCEGIVANVGDQLKKNDKNEDDEKGDESDNEHRKEAQIEEGQQDDEKEDDEKEGQQNDEEGQGRQGRQGEKEREEEEEEEEKAQTEKAEKERAGKAEKKREEGLESLLLEVQKVSARNKKKLAGGEG